MSCIMVGSLTNHTLQSEISRLVPPEHRGKDLTCDDRWQNDTEAVGLLPHPQAEVLNSSN